MGKKFGILINEKEESNRVPKKIRELKRLMLKAGFTYEPGKGNHTKWSRVLLSGKVALSDKDGDDAKPYQERDVQNALLRVQKLIDENER